MHQSFDADVFFPNIDAKKFTVESQSQVFIDKKSGMQYSFMILNSAGIASR
ncbi:MAG: dihydrofolate reductase [Prevotellaceae bacterium]|nr:dihydrofolate reductase [Prevotellaceae bacterium]